MHVRLLGIALAAIIAAILTAAPAAADNQSFLAAVSDLHSGYGPDGLLSAGKNACGIMRPGPFHEFGRSANIAAELVWQANPQLERPQAAQLVNAAIDNLCPPVNMYGYAS